MLLLVLFQLGKIKDSGATEAMNDRTKTKTILEDVTTCIHCTDAKRRQVGSHVCARVRVYADAFVSVGVRIRVV